MSCTYDLEKAPGDLKYVRVQVDTTSYPMGDQGWRLINDKTIELAPAACDVLRDGDDHFLTISVECEPVVLQ